MSIIEVEALAKTFNTRERAVGLSGTLHSFGVPRYRQREAVKHKGLLSCHNLLASPCDCAQYNEQDGNHIDTSYRNGEHPES
jgi:hypothetical protein